MPPYSWVLSERGLRRKPSFIRQLVKFISMPGMVSLGGGLPHPSLNPLHSMKMELVGGTQIDLDSALVTKATSYVPTSGFPPLVQWIRNYMKFEHHYPHDDNSYEIIVGTGSQDILQRVFDVLLDPSDSVIVEEYSYSGALAAIYPIGCNLVEIEMDEGGMIPKKLKQKLQNWPTTKRLPKAIYLVPIAQNPTGTSLSHERKKEIYHIAQEFDLAIIEDDPYWNLNFDFTDRGESFWSLDTDQRVIRLESLSKVTAVGYRVGWACAPSQIMKAISFDLEAGSQSSSGISQLIVHEIVNHLWNHESKRLWDAHISKIRQVYFERWKIIESAFLQHLTGIATWNNPSGGMMAWVKVLNMDDVTQFVAELATEKLVLLVPGAAFHSQSGSPSPYIRICYGYCDTELIEPSIKKLAEALKSKQK